MKRASGISAQPRKSVSDPSALRSAWSRLGALFPVHPATRPVDLEELICATALAARADQRLFVVPASWLAVHHHLVDARRLGRRIERFDIVASATMGALLSVASVGAGSKNALVSAAEHCRPLETPEPLFPSAGRSPGLLRLLQADALPLFERWGFWHDDATLQLSAVRPIGWILETCPELRFRLLLGPGLDAEVLAHAEAGVGSIAELARRIGSSYAATHGAVHKLAARGLLAAGPEGWFLGPTLALAHRRPADASARDLPARARVRM